MNICPFLMKDTEMIVLVLEGVLLTPLRIIEIPDGNVMHAIKKGSAGECGFGEAYFSVAEHSHVKAWKRHREMTLNLVVPVGKIRFVIFDDREESSTKNTFQEVILSIENYCRLTVPPMLWLGFQGVGDGLNLLMNIANIPHDPAESDRLDFGEIEYDWKENK